MEKKIIVSGIASISLVFAIVLFGLMSTNYAKEINKGGDVDLEMLWRQPLTFEFIRKHERIVNWNLVSQYANFSPNLLRTYQHRINWTIFLRYHSLSEDLLEEFIPYLDWNVVSRYQILSSCFIREHYKSLNLKDVLKYQKLTPTMEIFINNKLNVSQ